MDDQILDEGFSNSEKPILDAEQIKIINLTKIDVNENIKHIKSARVALIVLSVFTVIGVLMGLSSNPYGVSNAEILLEGAIIIAIYIGCAIGVRYNPVVSLIIGLSFYGIVILLYALVDFSTLFSGIIVKGVVIFYLIKGIQAGFQLKKGLAKLYRLGATELEISQGKSLIEISRR